MEDKAVYGLNRGVGLNKDKKIFDGGLWDQEASFRKESLDAAEDFEHRYPAP